MTVTHARFSHCVLATRPQRTVAPTLLSGRHPFQPRAPPPLMRERKRGRWGWKSLQEGLWLRGVVQGCPPRLAPGGGSAVGVRPGWKGSWARASVRGVGVPGRAELPSEVQWLGPRAGPFAWSALMGFTSRWGKRPGTSLGQDMKVSRGDVGLSLPELLTIRLHTVRLVVPAPGDR